MEVADIRTGARKNMRQRMTCAEMKNMRWRITETDKAVAAVDFTKGVIRNTRMRETRVDDNAMAGDLRKDVDATIRRRTRAEVAADSENGGGMRKNMTWRKTCPKKNMKNMMRRKRC